MPLPKSEVIKLLREIALTEPHRLFFVKDRVFRAEDLIPEVENETEYGKEFMRRFGE